MEQGIKKQSALAVETISLSKIYNGKAAVSHLDMKVQEGAIYGFIGRNGAGKSTTLKMLCGLARPTEGEIRLFGKSADTPISARRMGCLIESAGLYPHMTARQNAVMKAKCMGLTDPEAVDRVLEATGMNNTGKKKAKLFSMGMRQRLGIALALLGNPDLLVLDEPINGLDPESVREIRQLIQRLNEAGKTFIISSHILGELSKLSTHYGIIKDGNLVDKDGNELYAFKINGATIGNYGKGTTLSTIISDINSNNEAGVKVSYSQTTRKFTFTTGENSESTGITPIGWPSFLFLSALT